MFCQPTAAGGAADGSDSSNTKVPPLKQVTLPAHRVVGAASGPQLVCRRRRNNWRRTTASERGTSEDRAPGRA